MSTQDLCTRDTAGQRDPGAPTSLGHRRPSLLHFLPHPQAPLSPAVKSSLCSRAASGNWAAELTDARRADWKRYSADVDDQIVVNNCNEHSLSAHSTRVSCTRAGRFLRNLLSGGLTAIPLSRGQREIKKHLSNFWDALLGTPQPPPLPWPGAGIPGLTGK